jgi:glutamate racemase
MNKILIFDSGVGGISIYKAIKEQLPNADYFYLFDNAYFPYGELDPEFLIERVCQLFGYMYEKHKPDLVVIACNSASTLVLPALRERFPIAFVGVVPAIKPAALQSKKKSIGLLATPGTVSREYTRLLVSEHAQDCQIDMIGTTSLVLQAENKLYGHTVDLDEISDVVSKWKDPDNSPDVVVLGCTHFPLLIDELEITLGEHIKFIDSGMAIASRVRDILGNENRVAGRRKAGRAFCTKVQAQKKLTCLFNEIGLSQPLYIDV